MPYLFYREGEDDWVPRPLEDKPVDLTPPTSSEISTTTAESASEEAAMLVPVEGDGPGVVWTLLWGTKWTMRVNGKYQATGIRVLYNRDEIKVGEGDHDPVFFSTEKLAHVETFEGSDHEIVCPRCKRTIEANTPVVACPICEVYYHFCEDKDHDCWGYSSECLCGHSTSMDLGFLWTPQEVWRWPRS